MDHGADPFRHFWEAQDQVYGAVLAELDAGRKRSHWMWFIFPQLTALGRSATAKRYGLDDLGQAQAYLAHPVLGARLRECVALMLQHGNKPPTEILGGVDALKFRSCLTLFAQAAPDEALFQEALATFYGGESDALTLDLLRAV